MADICNTMADQSELKREACLKRVEILQSIIEKTIDRIHRLILAHTTLMILIVVFVADHDKDTNLYDVRDLCLALIGMWGLCTAWLVGLRRNQHAHVSAARKIWEQDLKVPFEPKKGFGGWGFWVAILVPAATTAAIVWWMLHRPTATAGH